MMATVSSGILSPNSYGLNTDQVAVAKMAAANTEHDSEFHHHLLQRTTSAYSNSTSRYSSDSEDNYNNRKNQNNNSPKRNKRKNFKPRCATSSNNYENYSENNNEEVSTKSSSRRKTQSTRKIIGGQKFQNVNVNVPMDLSQKNDSSDDNRSDEDSEEFDNYSGFSIRNLVKQQNQPSSQEQQDFDQPPHQNNSEMREFAMNTIKELLGICGLPDVTESITKQLPMAAAAFNSGKLFENLNFHLPTSSHSSMVVDGGGGCSSTSVHQPPTPPSTPLSPKSSGVETATAASAAPSSANKYTSLLSNFPNIPNLTITSSSQNFSNSSNKSPFHLMRRFKSVNGDGGGSSGGGKPSPSAASSSSEENVAMMMEMFEEKNEKSVRSASAAVNFSGYSPLSFPTFRQKTENLSSSPPPLELQSPLNAIIAQSLSTTSSTSNREPSSSNNSIMLNKTPNHLDYSKYVKKFSSAHDCGSSYCKDLNYREHFHCLDCNSRVFIKKEEMIRHFKWHKKRDESLQHGFMRYSPLDDCSDRYANCTHNKKQTHYHCIKEGCDKVYISTSDVQMHANYHRKDSAIIQEGFQRYRATEECGASYCAFFGQRTTHFHCRRSGCRFTFKNKSDMEKHKSYHIKDEQLSRDGFKKFMKNEVCPFENCRFSRVCNHIHCIRPQCSYVLHSSGQLFSHKRKHERKDSELAYRKYKLAQSMMKTIVNENYESGSENNLSQHGNFDNSLLNLSSFEQQHFYGGASNLSNCGSFSEENSPMSYDEENSAAMDLTNNSSLQLDDNSCNIWEENWKKLFQFCNSCEVCADSQHFHCMSDGCRTIFNAKDGSAKEHARNHELQEQLTENFFTTITGKDDVCEETCIYGDKEKHFHCNWENCREVILPSEKPFRRLEHYKMHEYSKKLSLTKDPLTATHLATSIDGMFCRKRGRPPKNRVIEVWNNDFSSPGGGSQSMMDSPQAIFTSFKLPKPFNNVSITTSSNPSSSKENSMLNNENNDSNEEDEMDWSSNEQLAGNFEFGAGFDVFGENTKCPDHLCPYLGSVHYHCNQNRCSYVTDKEEVLIMHSKDFHENIEILDNFEFFDRNVDCRLPDCPSNKTNRHFHCTRSDCNYSFVQYSTMALHNRKHEEEDDAEENETKISTPSEVEQLNKAMNLSATNNSGSGATTAAGGGSEKISVVKASGTFYPLSTLPTEQILKINNDHLCCKSIKTESQGANDDNSSSTLYGPERSCSRPFCKLKRKFHYHCNACNQAFSEIDKLTVHVAKHSTGALLNNNNNNSAISSEETKSGTNSSTTEARINVAPLQSLQNPPSNSSSSSIAKQMEMEQQTHQYLQPTFDPYFSNFPPNLQFALLQQHQNASFLPQSLYQNHPSLPQLMFQHSQLMQNPLLPSPYAAAAAAASSSGGSAGGGVVESAMAPLAAMAANLNKRSLSPHHHEMTQEQKKVRIQNSMRILKDEPVPEGYLRFRFNEDCHYQHCGYREHQTHFHCQRQDCGYSFCDKTRFVQHTARHERLDTLMGGDFQQYRANVACGRSECTYTNSLGSTQNKASHFHCLKCDFVCTDTNKVVAHRRQHQKLDSIQAAGFEKFTPSQQCRVGNNCQHSGKQTHYHCLQCQYAVLGLAQMSAHKYRHLEN